MFMDITDARDLETLGAQSTQKLEFPKKAVLQEQIKPLLETLNKSNIQSNLEQFTTFHNRFYQSEYGRQSSEWLLQTIDGMINKTGADKSGVTVKPFKHPWAQNSIIATIPGRTNSTIILGAHQDSINLTAPMTGGAPGADDDGSGTVTILEVFRALLGSQDLLDRKADNTIEFHWYSGEEGGLLGSQAVFNEYKKTGRVVKAMLQQDMTGYIEGTLAAGKPVAFALYIDRCEAYIPIWWS